MEERKTNELMATLEGYQTQYQDRYTLNSGKAESFVKMYDFFRVFAEDNGGRIVSYDVEPGTEPAKLLVEIDSADMRGDELKGFIDILQYVDVFETKATTSDSVQISVGVKNLWEG